MDVERLQIENIILETSYVIHDVISDHLYFTKSLAAMVIQGDGTVTNFHEIARALMENESVIANFLLAPEGVVTDVYPFEDNKAVIGLNLLDASEQEGNIEAIYAYEIGDLVIAGPFLLRQGYVGLVGRYPVYVDTETGGNKFWGLVSVTLKFPQVLDNTGLSVLEHHGFSYELWRINPDTNERQVIASNSENLRSGVLYAEKPIELHNAEWFLRIYPLRQWYAHPETWILAFAGLSVSLLGAFIVQYNTKLKRLKMRHVHDMENRISTLELELIESKISIMLSQIKPHFLYNSLIAIRELCLIDPKTASETVDEFSLYLRGNLDSLSINTPIPFDKELKHVQTYLSLEKKRSEERLNVVYDITTCDFNIPALTLQLIVENAVLHGLTKREEGGTVSIKTEENESDILITVSDDGVGFNLSNLSSDNRHVGLRNARDRLAAMCNGKLDIQSEQGVGTTVVITIPGGDYANEHHNS